MVTAAVVAVVSVEGVFDVADLLADLVVVTGSGTDVSVLTSCEMVERFDPVSDAQPTSTTAPIDAIATIVPARDLDRRCPTDTSSFRSTKVTLAARLVSFPSGPTRFSTLI